MTVDRFDQQVQGYDTQIRALQRDQAAVTFRSDQYFALQRRIDRLVAEKRRHEGNLPALRRGDRAVSRRLVACLIGVLVGFAGLAYFVSPWFIVGALITALLVYGVLATPR